MDTVAGSPNQEASPNSWNELEDAFLEKNYTELILLLKKGVSPNSSDDCGNTALMHACSIGSLVLVGILISFGAIVNQRNAENECALGYLCSYNDLDEENRIGIVQILIAFSENKSREERPGITFADIAESKGMLRLAQELRKTKEDG